MERDELLRTENKTKIQMSAKKKRVAVIGCGASGISALVAFAKAQENGGEIPEVVCFEKQSSMGGLWIYDGRVGVNEYGEPITSPMYRDLRLNSPKEVEEYYDYTYDEHFGQKPVPSYCDRATKLDYLIGRAKKYDVERFVKFSSVVTKVEKLGQEFSVIYKHLPSKESFEESFDYVIVASGLHPIPKTPNYPGIDTFPGRIIHSTDFKLPDELKLIDCLLIIGTSFSAMDIATFHYKIGGRKTLLSYHGEKPSFDLKWPDSVSYVSDLAHVSGSVCTFKDGSQYKVDMIVFATGYELKFPFLEPKLRLEAQGYRFVHHDLYKGVFYHGEPSMFYIGMLIPIYNFTLYERQAWLIKEFLMDRFTLPSKEDRKLDIDVWIQKAQSLPKRGGPLTNDPIYYNWLLDYMKDIVEDLNFPDKADLKFMVDVQYQNSINRSKNIITFRDVQFPSGYTGTMGKLCADH
ncbi:trimethylamine monooxygenase-like [Clytia hemisphaerica]|uniref:Flavin-containing monooxygenase n=1 Tax=Clytia hemisphaerica TaxID=252671 RepID=A0A7M5UD55_9CNID